MFICPHIKYKILILHSWDNFQNGEHNKFHFKMFPQVEGFLLGDGLPWSKSLRKDFIPVKPVTDQSRIQGRSSSGL